jgi:Xaa-Pro aminopeptidase
MTITERIRHFMDQVSERRHRLAQTLHADQLDAVLISHPINATYLTGFSGESSYLVLGEHRTVLVSDARFTAQISEECPGLETVIRPPSKTIQKAATEVVEKLGFRNVGFEAAHLTVADLETLKELAPSIAWKGGRDRVEKLRTIKDASEVAQIREAIAIAEQAFAAFRAHFGPEHTEKDLSDAMEMCVRRAGGRCTSFPTIAAAGERAALPHAPPTARKLDDAELLLVDWGASGRFYKSDLTRVLAARRISPKLQQVYTVVLTAQQQAIRSVRPGVKAHDVDAEARSVIAQEGFGEFFGHSLGHGIGLEVHEAPGLRQNNTTVLEAGMVVTVEPGIYLPGWGGVRIEDDVLVTPDGYEVLTSLPKDPIPIWEKHGG